MKHRLTLLAALLLAPLEATIQKEIKKSLQP
jgi:hypothetical protein